jgi:DNA-binding NarL/FixJ family response regulator
VSDLAVSVLENAGFSVRTAANGVEAVALYDEAVDILVTDMVMPELGGRELAERLLDRRSDLPVVYMSGYTEDRPGESTTFLQKPFSADALVKAVEAAVRGGGPLMTCVVADDHPAVLDAVSQYLEAQGVQVVGRAASGYEALRLIDEHHPTVALVDAAMEPLNGFEIVEEGLRLSPDTRSVVYTGHSGQQLVARTVAAGAHGIVLKEGSLAELRRALSAVAEGGTYMDPRLAAEPDEAPHLTPREQEILGYLAEGKSNDKVAQELGISPETVQSHVHNAMGKLEAETRTEAVAIALRRALIA